MILAWIVKASTTPCTTVLGSPSSNIARGKKICLSLSLRSTVVALSTSTSTSTSITSTQHLFLSLSTLLHHLFLLSRRRSTSSSSDQHLPQQKTDEEEAQHYGSRIKMTYCYPTHILFFLLLDRQHNSNTPHSSLFTLHSSLFTPHSSSLSSHVIIWLCTIVVLFWKKKCAAEKRQVLVQGPGSSTRVQGPVVVR